MLMRLFEEIVHGLSILEDRCNSCLKAKQLLYVYSRETPGFVVESLTLCAKCNLGRKFDNSWKRTLKIITPTYSPEQPK